MRGVAHESKLALTLNVVHDPIHEFPTRKRRLAGKMPALPAEHLGSWSKCTAAKWWRLSMNRWNPRQVLECASVVSPKWLVFCCAQFGLWRGARREHPSQWGCDRRATKPQAKLGATHRAAVLFAPGFVAHSLQIHFGIC